MVRIKQFHYFVALAKHLNYKAAAQALGISQSVLSQQIADLEVQIGAELFDRSRRSLELTPAGQALMSGLPDLFSLMYDTASLVNLVDRDLPAKEVIRIGYERPYDQELLFRFIHRYRETRPQTHFIVHQYNINELSGAPASQEIDVAFSLFPSLAYAPDTELHVFQHTALSLFIRKELIRQAPVQNIKKALAHIPLFCYQKASGGTNVVLRLCYSIGLTPEFRFCDTTDEIMLNVASGLGYTIIPQTCVEGRYDPEEVLALSLSGYAGSNICLVAASRPDNRSTAVTRFLETLPASSAGCSVCTHKDARCAGVSVFSL